MNLIFASHNQNKVVEIQKKMPAWITVQSLSDIDWVEEIEENGLTLEENAKIKCQVIAQKTGLACFADDTGLEVFSLNKEPGVYSARYAGKERSDEANMQKVLKNLKDQSDRTAQFRTVIYLFYNQEYFHFEGSVQGTILSEKKGAQGFGYDPIFQPEGFDCSFAQMTLEEKNELSHRGKAIQKLVEFLQNKEK